MHALNSDISRLVAVAHVDTGAVGHVHVSPVARDVDAITAGAVDFQAADADVAAAQDLQPVAALGVVIQQSVRVVAPVHEKRCAAALQAHV